MNIVSGGSTSNLGITAPLHSASQDTAATHLRFGGHFYACFVANFNRSFAVKKMNTLTAGRVIAKTKCHLFMVYSVLVLFVKF